MQTPPLAVIIYNDTENIKRLHNLRQKSVVVIWISQRKQQYSINASPCKVFTPIMNKGNRSYEQTTVIAARRFVAYSGEAYYQFIFKHKDCVSITVCLPGPDLSEVQREPRELLKGGMLSCSAVVGTSLFFMSDLQNFLRTVHDWQIVLCENALCLLQTSL